MESLFENISSMLPKGDFIKYQRQIYLKLNKFTRSFFLIGGILLIIGGCVCIMQGKNPYAVVFFMIGAYYLYSFKNHYKMMAGRYYLKALSTGSNEYHWIFYNDKAIRKTEDAQIKIDLNSLSYVFETDTHIFFAIGKISYWVDKSGFTKGSSDEFKEFLNEKLCQKI